MVSVSRMRVVHLVGEGQVVGHHQVHHNLVQHLVFVAALGQRRHQAGLHQAIDYVVFSLGNPMREACSGPTSCDSALLSTASSTFTLTFSLSRVGSFSE